MQKIPNEIAFLTTQEKTMLKKINNNNYPYISPSGPMYWPQNHNRYIDILDFFFINNLNDISSDYTPVLLKLKETLDKTRMHLSKNT